MTGDLTTDLLLGLARAGRLTRQAALRLETLRTVGAATALRRRQEEIELKRVGRQAMRSASHLEIWQEAASALGATLEPLDGDLIRIRRDDSATIVCGRSVMLDDAVTLRIAEDKRLAHDMLARAGLPIADQLCFEASDTRPAEEFLEAAGSACVVKPAASTGGGAGTTGGVRKRGDLRRAALKAWRWGPRVLIERQAPGLVYRLLFLEGELLDVVQRRPPALAGDGRSTVAELIARENQRRIGERSLIGSLLRVDLDAVLTLREAGLSLRAVPPAEMEFQVKAITSQNARRDNVTYRDTLSKELVSDARAAAATLGVRLAGIDLVTTDPGRSLSATGGAIVEVNGEPGLEHHYQVAGGDAHTRVAVPILRRLLEQAPVPTAY